jgi:hypothetical protein
MQAGLQYRQNRVIVNLQISAGGFVHVNASTWGRGAPGPFLGSCASLTRLPRERSGFCCLVTGEGYSLFRSI